MQEPESGVVQAHAVIGDDGRLLVVLEWPNGEKRVLDRDVAVAHSLAVLNAAAKLFPNAAEFSKTIDLAREVVRPMQPPESIQ
jgi:hypothetical protein